MIPLFEVNGHELVSLNGKKSSFYQIIPSDIEGMTDFSQKEIFSELERNLVDYEDMAKIYWINNKLYINAFSDIELANAEIKPCNEPLTTFINNYSDQVSFYENYLTVGNEFIRLLSIKDYPASLNLLETQIWPVQFPLKHLSSTQENIEWPLLQQRYMLSGKHLSILVLIAR